MAKAVRARARPRDGGARDLRAVELVWGGERVRVISVPARTPAWALLSVAERAVAEGVLRGLTNAEIARERGCTVRTIANQVRAVFAKLGCSSRAELAALA